MAHYYLQIKQWHVLLVLLSGALFAFRGGMAVTLGRRWSWLDWSSYLIDSLLLTAALMLLAILHLNPLSTPWLGLKLVLLLLYIGLGALAMRPIAKSWRYACLLAALLVYAWMYGVARAHHPLGWWQLLPG
ncbi:MAG: SirB2 family protein [Xanthomonadales bacterium]|nr:SirB2 family protein [Xanthomonadales bacterium]